MTLDTRVKNEDLVLEVSETYDPAKWNPDRYAAFIDALCGSREYQKEALLTVLRYLLGERYENLYSLAEANFNSSDILPQDYGSLGQLVDRLGFPTRLAANVDLATGTGKSYVIYGLARIMLAEGVVDRVLVLAPSVTIERELLEKFRSLSERPELLDLLPADAAIANPHITDATSTITRGDICVENFHAALSHVGSSIRESLRGKGSTTLVLNDEVHHLYSPHGSDLKKWKEFLLDPDFGFRYIVGLSGTCYIGNDYFPDVVYRYSLREAIDDGVVKTIDYVAEDTRGTQNEQFQKILANHQSNQRTYGRVKPLSIFVTKNINTAERLAEDYRAFLQDQGYWNDGDHDDPVLVVTSSPRHAENIARLDRVDFSDEPTEFIMSVSMLTEGWDVQNVFQIVPHEERAFNSKLLIAQVLGRGLRVPPEYRGERPAVTVFNHSSWSTKIEALVQEVLDIEHRVRSLPVTDPREQFHFDIHQLDYDREKVTEETQANGNYKFDKGYIQLASQVESVDHETKYARALTGSRYSRVTNIRYKMHSLNDVVDHIHRKLQAIDMEADTNYAEEYDKSWLKSLVRESLRRVGEERDIVSEENRQRLQGAFGVIHRASNRVVRYRTSSKNMRVVNTRSRPHDSVGVHLLKRMDTTVFYDDHSVDLTPTQYRLALQEVIDDQSIPRGALFHVGNSSFFKAPLNVVLASYSNERQFIEELLNRNNAEKLDAWIKSTDREFYSIEYSWRQGNHTKRAGFNPDFFIKAGSRIFVVEIKGDEQIGEPSTENRAKYHAAKDHFSRIDARQSEISYSFNFLTPRDFPKFFLFLREEREGFTSDLDVALADDGTGT